MPFPLTHMCVAWEILKTNPMEEREAAQFILGSISPDAVHYRAEFLNRGVMNKIGPSKKVTHLCPISDEKWGQVTDNEGWRECVKEFFYKSAQNSFSKGYAVHVLTDIQNNLTIWNKFCKNHPEEAAKGYASDYYKDLKNIDTRLYKEYPGVPKVMELLKKSTPEGMQKLVSAEEVSAIKHNLLYEHFKNEEYEKNYQFATYTDTIDFIKSTALEIIKLGLCF
ncbi:MAG: hypothetical protein FWF81_08700 [Defluviitaleaceae bacterium]|nr:hypothetical protein [Defluviitaleaceae bacterium]